ncbi:hypothetical protein LUZ60_000455 [Juncus effusus]|nr:hypothetical protein LUZ60_000455 [Juncus effusus]
MMDRTTQSRAKSAVRRPLADKSSCVNRVEKSCIKKEAVRDSDSVQRILAVRSDLSDLVSQINQLVTQASQQKELSKRANQEIESFTNVLSDLRSILKPWVPRLEQAFNSKDQLKTCSTPYFSQKGKEKENQIEGKTDFSELESLVSPSPLVSWRPGPCTDFDAGKQLFLLTPLEKSRLGPKTLIPSKKSPIQFKKTPIAPKSEFNFNPPNTLVSKTLIGSKPEIEVSKTVKDLKYQRDEGKSTIVEPIRVSESLNFNFQHQLGFNESPKMIHRKRDVTGTLDWFLSPPKTCVLMEPSDEKKPTNLQITPCEKSNKNIENWENDLYMSTAGKKGEATLKRELWTRFESVSNGPFSFNNEVFGKKDGKGFLDMLEEVEN